MEITFVWSWLAFFAGVGATIVAGFWLILGIAFKQWRKRQKETLNIDKMFQSWKKEEQ